MEIINPEVAADLAAGRPIRLDLGSGGKQRPGFYAVDHLMLPGVDIIADLNQAFSLLPDNSVCELYSRHTLEHVQQFLPLMREIHRVCRADAVIEIIVPHFSNVYGFSDPTHVRFFGLYTMNYFVAAEDQPRLRRVPAFYTDVRFAVDSIRFEFYRQGRIDRVLADVFEKLVNRSLSWQDFYERRLCHVFHAWQLVYRMHPNKPRAPTA